MNCKIFCGKMAVNPTSLAKFMRDFIRFSAQGGRLVRRLWLIQAAGTGVALATGAFASQPIVLGLAGALLLAGNYFFLAKILAPLDAMRERMLEICRRTAEDEALLHAQEDLDANIKLLRDRLYADGEPRRVGDELYFGDRRINEDFTDVDWVKAQAGGTATIFCGDMRIATNVLRPEGGRAIGTRLAAGPVHDCVFKDAKTYRGEAEILGVTYLTIYEPIFGGEEVIGVLYVGVPKALAAEADGKAKTKRRTGRNGRDHRQARCGARAPNPKPNAKPPTSAMPARICVAATS